MNKTTSYQLFYNLVRPNFSKKGKTPMQIIEEDRKGNFLNLLQETVDLDQLFRIKYKSLKRGQHLPELPVINHKNIYFFFNSFYEGEINRYFYEKKDSDLFR